MARIARIALAVALAVVLMGPPAQAAYVEFASLLGTNFSDNDGVSTGHSLAGFGLSGLSADFYGFSWYSAGSWAAGANPGAGNAAGLYMTAYRNDYGLAVGVKPNAPPLDNLPSTGVNELDSREGLVVSFNAPVYLSSFTLGNFFNDTNNLNQPSETGWVVFDGNYAVPLNFTAPVGQFVSDGGSGSYAGTYVVTLPTPVLVSSISFFASEQLANTNWSSDYLVRGVDISTPAVPEPGSLLLFGSAAGAVAWLRRRRKA
ncbi:MAG: PEP-CTERM sorting domain-containing protein [Thermodesulfobacteriota bacterium]